MGRNARRRKLLVKYAEIEKQYNERKEQLKMLEKHFLSMGCCVDSIEDWINE